jgi:hypothetical protein
VPGNVKPTLLASRGKTNRKVKPQLDACPGLARTARMNCSGANVLFQRPNRGDEAIELCGGSSTSVIRRHGTLNHNFRL